MSEPKGRSTGRRRPHEDRHARRPLRPIWYATASVVVLAAVLLGLARLLFPLVGRYQPEIERWASEGAGMPVRVARVSGRWQGLHPEVLLEGVRVLDRGRGRPWLEVRRVRVVLDLVRSLRAGRLAAARIEVAGAALAVARDESGRIRVLGLRARERTGPAGPLVGRLAAAVRGGLELREVRLVYQEPGVAPLLLERVHLRLRVREGAAELAASAQLPPELGERARIVARLPVGRAAAGAPDGDYHLVVDALRLDHPLVRARLPQGIGLGGRVRTRLWARVREHRLTWLAGEGAVTGLRLAVPGRHPLALRHASARFDWRRLRGGGWRLAVAGFRRHGVAGTPAPATFAIEVRPDELGVGTVRAAARELRVEDAAAVASLLAEGRALAWLEAAAPRGRLRTLVLAGMREEDGTPHFALRAELEDLRVGTAEGLPGVTGLDLAVTATERAMRMDLRTRDATLRLPGLFEGPLVVGRLEGPVRARWDEVGWVAWTPRLALRNRDLAGELRGSLRGGFPPRRSNLHADLVARFTAAPAEHVSAYLPLRGIPAPVRRWLVEAVRGGRATEGASVLRGPLAHFPFRAGEGRFLVRFGLEDGRLAYTRGWPELTRARGEVRFEQDAFEARVAAGRILGAAVEDLHIGIAHMRRGAVLALSGKVRGTLDDGITFLRQTRIAGPGYTAWLGRVGGEGPMRLALNLRLPLGRHRRMPPEYEGRLRVEDGVLRDLERGVTVTRLHGTVTFSRAGLASDGIAGRFLGRPVRAVLLPAEGATRLQAEARLPVEAVARLSGVTLPRFVSGGAAWVLEVLLPRKAALPLVLTLRSRLAGVAVALPAPLGKPAAAVVPSWLRAEVAAGRLRSLSFRYGDRLGGRLAWHEGTLAGLLGLGAGLPQGRLPPRGLVLIGEAREADLDAWRAWLAAGEGAGVPGGGPAAALRGANVRFGRARLLGTVWPALALRAERAEDDGWRLGLDSPRLAGDVLLAPAGSSRPWRLRLARLHLPAVPPGTEGRGGGGPDMEPARLPPLDLRIDDLRVGGRAFGRLEARSRAVGDELRIGTLSLAGPALRLQGEGGWTARGGRHQTRFRGSAQTGDLEAALRLLGYAAGVEARHAAAELEVGWEGPPWRPRLAAMNGRLHLRIVRGRLTQVDPGAGRLFGLLSLNALPRRLSLDFSDLFSRGLAFDWIEGDFLLEEGDAYTHNLTLEGPSARIEVSGRIGLARRDYDQHVRVTPHVSGGLPLAGALLGGPAVGAAILFLQQVVRDPISRAARHEYRLTGSWDAPKVERLSRNAAPEGEGG